MENEKFINSIEAAKLLEVHVKTLNRWITKHKKDKNYRCPPYYLMGGNFKFKKSEIDSFIVESRIYE